MKRLAFLFFLTPVLAFALDGRPTEIGLTPGLYYSSAGGARFSVGAFFKIPVSNHLQLKLGDENLLASHGSHRFVAGLNYNFSEDWLSSFFAGVGIGYQRNGQDRPWGNRNYWFGYAEGGKRFTLIRSWGLSYAPQIQFSWGPDARPEIHVMPANFTMFF